MGLIQAPHISLSAIQVEGPIKAGVPAQVIVNTFGSSSCTTANGMDVAYSGDVISLTPWDYVRQQTVCTDDLRPHPHHVLITVANPGTVTIIAHGYVRDFNNRQVRGSVTLQVPVQP